MHEEAQALKSDGKGRAPVLKIVEFAAADRKRYLIWNQIRWTVFADEMGWKLPDHSVGESGFFDPFDEHARLLLGEDAETPIGIVRTLRVTTGFPHRELFEGHLRASGLERQFSSIGTINALAVIPSRRRRTFFSESQRFHGTAAALLVRAALDELSRSGVSVVLATVLSAISARVFLRAGFHLLDVPFASPDDSRFTLANIGRVLAGSSVHDVPGGSAIRERESGQVAEYFARCEALVFSHGTLDQLFPSDP